MNKQAIITKLTALVAVNAQMEAYHALKKDDAFSRGITAAYSAQNKQLKKLLNEARG